MSAPPLIIYGTGALAGLKEVTYRGSIGLEIQAIGKVSVSRFGLAEGDVKFKAPTSLITSLAPAFGAVHPILSYLNIETIEIDYDVAYSEINAHYAGAYRLVHGSYKGLSWSRDLALKWVALLAHYVPDCEREYLPLACTPGPTIDYVHHDVRPEGVYAATLVITAGIAPEVSSELSALVSIRFEADQNDRLLGLSLWLYGLAKMLEMVGRAQISLMDSWLDPAAGAQPEDEAVSRDLRRNAGIYRDFYDLGFIINFPDPLGAILKGFHAGTTRVKHGRRAAPFAEIWHRYQEIATSTPPNLESAFPVFYENESPSALGHPPRFSPLNRLLCATRGRNRDHGQPCEHLD